MYVPDVFKELVIQTKLRNWGIFWLLFTRQTLERCKQRLQLTDPIVMNNFSWKLIQIKISLDKFSLCKSI